MACHPGAFSARLLNGYELLSIPIQLSIALASGACYPLPLYPCRDSRFFHAAEGLPHSWLDFPLLRRGSCLAMIRWAFYLFSPELLERGKDSRLSSCPLAIPPLESRPGLISLPLNPDSVSFCYRASGVLGYPRELSAGGYAFRGLPLYLRGLPRWA